MQYTISGGQIMVEDWARDRLERVIRPAHSHEVIPALVQMIAELQRDVADLKGRLLNVAVGL